MDDRLPDGIGHRFRVVYGLGSMRDTLTFDVRMSLASADRALETTGGCVDAIDRRLIGGTGEAFLVSCDGPL